MKTAIKIAVRLSLTAMLLAGSSAAWAQENTSTIAYRQNHDINTALISPRGWASIKACKAKMDASVAISGAPAKEVEQGLVNLAWLYEVMSKTDLQTSIGYVNQDLAEPNVSKAERADHEMVLCQLNYLMATLPR